MKKILLIIFLFIVIAVAGIAGYLKFVLPKTSPPPDLKVSLTPERIQHGAYLANHVLVCMDCHSTRDWSRFTAPLVPGTLGIGGEFFGREMGFPGNFYSKNITPASLSSWTDGEIFRVITTGIDKNGNALFPVMPYAHYGKMDKEDVYDIIAYLRQLPAIKSTVPERSIDFPMNFIINTIPIPSVPMERPAQTDMVKYGGYLVMVAACTECHTQAEKGKLIPGLEFAGGREFQMPNGVLRSANISPDVETGIGNWTEDVFVTRFKAYTDSANISKIENARVNTIMPWAMYAGMDTTDLKAIYTYLKTLKAIKNQVEHFQLSSK